MQEQFRKLENAKHSLNLQKRRKKMKAAAKQRTKREQAKNVLRKKRMY